jgi:hypothetical protein
MQNILCICKANYLKQLVIQNKQYCTLDYLMKLGAVTNQMLFRTFI